MRRSRKRSAQRDGALLRSRSQKNDHVQKLVDAILTWFALPENGLSSVFVISFLSATLLPLGSEPMVFGYTKLNPQHFWLAVTVATLGNTLGGAVDYWMGWAAKVVVAPHHRTRYLRWFERLGPRAMVLAWLPVLGDPLCVAAGWLRLPFWSCVLWMAIGKFLRYTTMTAMLLWVPDAWWTRLLRPLAG